MRTLKALLACCVVTLMVATLAGPVSAEDLPDDEYAAILTSLADRLTAAQAEVQAELEAVDACIQDPECYVALRGGQPLYIATRSQDEWMGRLLLLPQIEGESDAEWVKKMRAEFSTSVGMSPETKRNRLRGIRANLLSERANLTEMGRQVAEELDALAEQPPPDASVAESEAGDDGPASQIAGTDTAEIAEGPSLRDFGIDADAIPGGDGFGYAVVCKFISTENGLEIARSKLRSPSRAEIGQTIALVPNGCRPTATRSTQLEIEVTRIGDPASTVTVSGSVLTGE